MVSIEWYRAHGSSMSFQHHVNLFERAQVFRPDSTASNNIQHWEMMSLLLVTQATRKKTQILPTRVWPMSLWLLVQMLYHWAIGVLGVSCQVLRQFNFRFMGLACEQTLRGALATGREKEGELETTSLEFEFRLQFPLGSPLTELSYFRQTLKNTWKQAPRVMTSLLMLSPPISISHRLFRCRYSNSRDVVASFPSFSRPAARVHRRAWLQAIHDKHPGYY